MSYLERVMQRIKSNSFFSYIVRLIIVGGAFACLMYSMWKKADYQDKLFTTESKTLFYCAAILLCVFLLLCMKKKQGIVIFVCVMLVLGMICAIWDAELSPIDEGAHEAYIDYIIENHRLPTFFDENTHFYDPETDAIVFPDTNYEVVHPPVYYLLCALVGSFVSNPYARLVASRLLGLGFLLGSFIITYKILCKLQSINNKSPDKVYFYYGLILFVMPGVLVRFSHLSNDVLLIFLYSFMIYLCVHLITCEYKKPEMFLLGIVCAIAFLTKNTSAFCVILVFVVGIYYHRWKDTAAVLCVFVLFVSPWLIWNYKIYGSFTAMKYHVEYVLPIVNPTGKSYDWIEIYLSDFWPSFWGAQEVSVPTGVYILEAFFTGLFTLMLLLWTKQILSQGIQIFKNRFNFRYTQTERKAVVVFSMKLLIIGSFLFIMMGCFSTGIRGVLGRYLHCTIPAFAVLVCLTFADEAYQRLLPLCRFFCIFLALLTTRAMLFYAYKCFPHQIPEGEYSLADVSDEHWINGISVDGKILLLEEDKVYDFNLLENAVISTDGETMISVQEVKHSGEYVWLILEEPTETSLDGTILIQYN